MTAGPRRAGGLHSLLVATGALLLRLPRGLAGVGVLAWMGLITWFSSWPAKPSPGFTVLSLTTNLGHAFLFGILALWAALALPRHGGWPELDRRTRAWLVGLAGAFGLVDELHQHLAGLGRNFSLFDVVTDLVGAFCVLSVAAYLRRPDSTAGGVAARLALATVACLAAAAAATWGPLTWPDVYWL